MKFLITAFSMFVLMGAAMAADDQGGAAAKPAQKKLSGVGGPQASGKLLTDEEISSFKTEWVNEKTGVKMQFSASFGVATPSEASEKRKYVKSGKIPIRITCALYEIKNPDSPKPLMKRVSGNAQLYVLDSEGKMVEKKTVSLDKMCPS